MEFIDQSVIRLIVPAVLRTVSSKNYRCFKLILLVRETGLHCVIIMYLRGIRHSNIFQ